MLEASATVECLDVDVKVFDTAAVVNILPPGKSTSVFLNYVIKQAQNIKRIDFISYQYFENGLKRSTRDRRETREYEGACAITHPFQSTGRAFCYRMKTKKKELFHYFAESVTAIQLPGVEKFEKHVKFVYGQTEAFMEISRGNRPLSIY